MLIYALINANFREDSAINIEILPSRHQGERLQTHYTSSYGFRNSTFETESCTFHTYASFTTALMEAYQRSNYGGNFLSTHRIDHSSQKEYRTHYGHGRDGSIILQQASSVKDVATSLHSMIQNERNRKRIIFAKLNGTRPQSQEPPKLKRTMNTDMH